jgi:integrase
MPAKLEKTRGTPPGIFKRGARYVVIYRDANGRQRQESAPNLDAAKRLRVRRSASVEDGSHQPQTRERFVDYARAWVERYQGNGRRGFTEDTRADYKRDLERYAIPHLGRLRLEQITPRHVAGFVAWLCDESEQGQRRADELREAGKEVPEQVEPVYLADASVRRILAPVRACLRTATAEGVIRHNPTHGAALPARDERLRIEQGTDELDEHDVRVLSTEQLAALLAVMPAPHKLLVRLLAATGMRISEAFALRWGDLQLDGERPAVRVRRAYVRGKFKPPKSKYGRRDVPIDFELVRELRRARGASDYDGERDLVFCTPRGTPLDYRNLLTRTFKPAAQEADVSWAAFHTLRHTCASRLFAAGRNAVQVQRWLGHHSPAFTLTVYVHLLDEDLGGPLAVPGCQQVPAQATESTRNEPQRTVAIAA